MVAKITVTTACGAKCATCPMWKYPAREMDRRHFKVIMEKLDKSKYVHGVMMNSTGDCYYHSERDAILDEMERCGKPVLMTTNASRMHRIPRIALVIISFNGGTRESYERTTGLDFDQVVENIRAQYEAFKKVRTELHCLMWEGNAGTERDLLELWGDFPGRIRVSYKYDNQFGEDRAIEKKEFEREPCDYLGNMVIMPDCSVVQCSHDFGGKVVFGNLIGRPVEDILRSPARAKVVLEHARHEWQGLCARCNYNTGERGRVKYIK